MSTAVKALGPLKPNDHLPQFLESKPVYVPCLGRAVPFSLFDMPEDSVGEWESVIDTFLKLDVQVSELTKEYVFAHYLDFEELLEPDELAISNADEVWEHVTVTDIYVKKLMKDGRIYVSIAADCEWDQEHGIQIVLREGNTLTRVSSQDGHLANQSPWENQILVRRSDYE